MQLWHISFLPNGSSSSILRSTEKSYSFLQTECEANVHVGLQNIHHPYCTLSSSTFKLHYDHHQNYYKHREAQCRLQIMQYLHLTNVSNFFQNPDCLTSYKVYQSKSVQKDILGELLVWTCKSWQWAKCVKTCDVCFTSVVPDHDLLFIACMAFVREIIKCACEELLTHMLQSSNATSFSFCLILQNGQILLVLGAALLNLPQHKCTSC